MTTQEKNKVLAEFMELPTQDGKYADWDGLHDVKYHTSWDWLMPVVEKIESENPHLFRIEGYMCTIERSDNENPHYPKFKIQTHCKTKLEATYEACFQFITWYNKTKQK